ncbi:MAG TPA: hypothetical protein PLP87_09050 [Clostridiales bacterium]|nr:hypothetical protein [Clostridiales bacterium]
MEIVQGGYTIRKMVAGSGGGSKGDVAVVSFNKAVKAATGPAAGTVLGLFLEDVAENGIALIAVPDKNAIIRAPYIGTTLKSSLADSDLGKVFGLKDEKSIYLDDTTGAVCICQSYDNENKTIDFVFTQAATYW